MTHQEEKNIIEKSSHNLVQPHLGRIFFARLFDLIVCSIPTLILTFLNPITDLKTLFINLPVSQIVLFIYFILLPYFWKGNTIGKLIFSLRLIKDNNKKIKMKEIFFREFYFLYIPLVIQLVIQLIIGLIIFTSDDPENIKSLSFIVTTIRNIGFTFLAIWFIYIPITIYLQKEHISAVDLKLNTKVYYLEKVLIINKREKSKNHIHLQKDRPGNFDLEEIDKIIDQDKDLNN
ncbi:RDD family protein [Spiroplasma monobiae]|uniref:RDD domain-containing protein n=1 Tax=Spiroplasma monobiae MQ-1 TaxID=1336748 RepID=A0A2K9LTC3_SPISQ|nr:RDD family protein [Spiroplasma monobiae]AUM62346.1 hypothetical protein SMONO_v1c00930 [Spiroplasma monobiae MQ-1]